MNREILSLINQITTGTYIAEEYAIVDMDDDEKPIKVFDTRKEANAELKKLKEKRPIKYENCKVKKHEKKEDSDDVKEKKKEHASLKTQIAQLQSLHPTIRNTPKMKAHIKNVTDRFVKLETELGM